MQFDDYGKWAEWTSAVSSLNPNIKLSALEAKALLGKEGEYNPETLVHLISTHVMECARDGWLTYKMLQRIEDVETFTNTQKLLQSHGLDLIDSDEGTWISWDQQSGVDDLQSPYLLEGVPFGIWAYWFTRSMQALPITKCPIESTAAELRLVPMWESIRNAVMYGKMEETVLVPNKLAQEFQLIRETLELNGIQFNESEGPGGGMQLCIHIRHQYLSPLLKN